MKLVILDRDGVINADSDAYIKSPAEWVPISGSLEAIASLTNAGMTVAVATNQSGLARGLFDIDTLNRIHGLMVERVGAVGGRIDAIAFCPHGPDAGCGCRKPAPGLLLALAKRFGVSLLDVPVVGDSVRDLEAAAQCGCETHPGSFRQRAPRGRQSPGASSRRVSWSMISNPPFQPSLPSAFS